MIRRVSDIIQILGRPGCVILYHYELARLGDVPSHNVSCGSYACGMGSGERIRGN